MNSYFKEDWDKYDRMLKSMSSRWHLYISVLETEIIEAKLRCIIDSLTFKYSRQPELLSLIPDRMTEINLRIAGTIKIVNDSGTGGAQKSATDGDGQAKNQGAATSMNNDKKFYKDVYGDPDRASDLRKHCESVMYACSKKQEFCRLNKNK